MYMQSNKVVKVIFLFRAEKAVDFISYGFMHYYRIIINEYPDINPKPI